MYENEKDEKKNVIPTLVFVDITQNSLLINKWREIEGNNKMEQKKIIKLIEKSGIGLIKTVTPSNHFWLNCINFMNTLLVMRARNSLTVEKNLWYTILCTKCLKK